MILSSTRTQGQYHLQNTVTMQLCHFHSSTDHKLPKLLQSKWGVLLTFIGWVEIPMVLQHGWCFSCHEWSFKFLVHSN